MRQGARLALVAVVTVIMVFALALPTGLRGTERAGAVAPDVYQVTAGSSVIDTDSFQTGVISPSPFFNTAFPLTSVTSNNQPLAEAHAAFLEPPQSAQAASNLNNVAIPYPTQAEALCANCDTPLSEDADGNIDQHINGTRITLGAGHAHAQSNKLTAFGDASNGVQTIGSLDQLTTLYTEAVASFYANVVNHPGSTPPPKPLNAPPGCADAPQSALTPNKQVCPAAPPTVSVVAQTGGSSSHSQVVTDDNGTAVDTLSNVSATKLFNGLIYIASIATEVKALGDGTSAGTRVDATNAIQGVCVNNDCHYSITTQGICKSGSSACENDGVQPGAAHAGLQPLQAQRPDREGGQLGRRRLLGAAPRVARQERRPGQQGPRPRLLQELRQQRLRERHRHSARQLRRHLLLPEDRAQRGPAHHQEVPGLRRRLQPNGGSPPSSTGSGTAATGGSALTGTGGAYTLGGGTPNFGGLPSTGGARPQVPLGTERGGASLEGVKDRRPLLLSVFGLLEVVLLCNLTAMTLARRGG